MATTIGFNNVEVTPDDRSMATLVHALSILGFIPSLVIFLVKRQSRFVSFHALQALLWHIAYMMGMMVFMVLWFALMFSTVFSSISHLGPNARPEPPMAMIALFPLIWLGFMAGSMINLVLVIVYSIKANQGEWTNFPIFGPLARKILKMGPVGAGVV